jgi:hypothetical protein
VTKLRAGLCFLVLLLTLPVRAETVGAPTAVRPLAELTDAEFAFVSRHEGRTFWVSRMSWEGPALRTHPKWLDDDTAFAKLAEQSLPDSLRALTHKDVSLFDADGKPLCQTSLQAWGVLAEYDQGDDNWADLSKRALLERMYAAESDARRRYAAELKVPAGCEQARWARAASLPPTPVFKLTALKGKALLAERARLRAAPEWTEAQQRFAKQEKGRWDEHPDTQVRAYSCQVRGERYLLATLFQFNDCESFAADVVLTLRGRGKQAVQLPNNLSTEVEPVLALDLNGDGIPEWLTTDTLIGWDGERFGTVIDNSSLFSSCPC